MRFVVQLVKCIFHFARSTKMAVVTELIVSAIGTEKMKIPKIFIRIYYSTSLRQTDRYGCRKLIARHFCT